MRTNDRFFVDVLVHNEGKLSLEALLVEFLQENPDLEKIPGISINQDGSSLQTGGNPVLPKELPIPSPYLKGMFEPFFAESSEARIALWETNRGCPYSCSFCDWGVRTMNRLRLHSFDKAVREIEYLARKQIEDIYITDCNFGIFKRDTFLNGICSLFEIGIHDNIRVFELKKNDPVAFTRAAIGIS